MIRKSSGLTSGKTGMMKFGSFMLTTLMLSPFYLCPASSPALASTPNSEERIGEQSASSKGSIPATPAEKLDLRAYEVVYYEKEQIIIAKGEVELVYEGRILRARNVSYNLQLDTASAQGEVVLVQPDGEVHFADEFEFRNELKEGFVKGLYSYLAEGARLKAERGDQIEGGNKVVMRNASYTPCIPCELDENAPLREQLITERVPAWAISADKIIHDKVNQQIVYEDARFNFHGIPVLYSPYFAHPDGSVKQKSGFLAPSFGFDSDLGPHVTGRYYWGVDSDKDATFGLMVPTNEAPVALAEYRQRFQNARLSFSGSATSSDRTDEENGVEIKRDNEFRGHIFGHGLWNINRRWRAGFDIERSTDDQYLRQYNITSEDVLETEMYAERFEDRDYLTVRGFGFQDTRIRADDIDQPNILPEIVFSKVGKPGSALGGRLDLEASFLGLQREGEGQDLSRAVLETGWRRRSVFPVGLIMDNRARLRGDFFNVRDSDSAKLDPNLSENETESRAFAQLHNILRYPLLKSFENSRLVIEPIAAVTISPDISQKEEDIPNEDSQDIQLDVSTIFNPNRFPGKDRIEDKSRVTYGMNAGFYLEDSSSARLFVGQSYTFDDSNTLFPEGSGLSQRDSDVVGSLGLSYQNYLDLDYRFQFDNESFQSRRHELTSFTRYGRATLNTSYFYSRGLEDTAVSQTREQLRMSSALWLDQKRQWRSSAGFTHDFAEDQGLRRAFLGLSFINECRCWNASFTAVRNLTTEASGESSTEFLIQIGFENLGSFGNANLR